MTLEDLEVDELPLAQRLRGKLMVEDAKHEAHCHWYFAGTTALLGLVHNSHNWYVDTHEPQAPQARTHIVWASTQCPGTLFILVV